MLVFLGIGGEVKPNFIGIGAQKCASTWIYRVLQDHPEVLVATPKELDFFSYFYGRGFQWYERHFQSKQNVRAIGEISPSYFCDPCAPYRINAYNSEMRIIITLRDPLERAYSNHLHEVRMGHFEGEDISFESGLRNNPMYIEQSRYGTHLKNWFDVVPEERRLVLLQEEIKQSPDEQVRRIYNFLNIDEKHSPQFLNQRANRSYLPRSKALEKLIKKSGHSARKAGFGKAVDAIKQTGLVDYIRNLNRFDARLKVPAMKEETKWSMAHELRSEVVQTAALLGRQSLPWETWDLIVKDEECVKLASGDH